MTPPHDPFPHDPFPHEAFPHDLFPQAPPDPDAGAPLHARFVFDYRPSEDPGEGQRWSTWHDVEPLCRGPEPRPDWLVTDRAALDTELGVLKTGKEADVSLLERAVPGGASCTLAAKRYRAPDHRSFHRSAAYTEGRRLRSTRDTRALARKSAHGRAVAAGQWAAAEWQALVALHAAGVPVPYPVQVDGTELLLEWVHVEGPDGPETAPRLAQLRAAPERLAGWFEQVRAALAAMLDLGLVHGDLSAYNLLVAGDRVVVIDLPQAVDVVANPLGIDFLVRDCANVCAWFRQKGLEVDEDALVGDLLAHAF